MLWCRLKNALMVEPFIFWSCVLLTVCTTNKMRFHACRSNTSVLMMSWYHMLQGRSKRSRRSDFDRTTFCLRKWVRLNYSYAQGHASDVPTAFGSYRNYGSEVRWYIQETFHHPLDFSYSKRYLCGENVVPCWFTP